MRLIGLDIRGFRTLTDISMAPLSPLSVLVGPNNTGKSNVVSALVRMTVPFKGGPTFLSSDFSFLSPTVDSRVSITLDLETSELVSAIQRTEVSWQLTQESLLRHFRPKLGGLTRWTVGARFFPTPVSDRPAQALPLVEAPWGKRRLHELLEVAPAVEVEALQGRQNRQWTEIEAELKSQVGGYVSRLISTLGPIRRPATRIQANPADTIQDDASNLAAALYRHWGATDSVFRRLQSSIHYVFPQVEGVVLVPEGNQLRLGIRESGQDIVVPWEAVSSGIAEAACILAGLALAPDGSVVTIEEPEVHFHPAAISRLVKVIVRESARLNILVITHSTELLYDLASTKTIWVATRNRDSRGVPTDTAIASRNREEYINELEKLMREIPADSPGMV